jgi:hypothetical protein
MTEITPNPLNNIISIDDERIKNHLDRVVRGSVEETLNALLEAEANRLCMRSATSAARRVGIHARATSATAKPAPAMAQIVKNSDTRLSQTRLRLSSSSLIMLSASKTATRAFVQMIKRCVAGLALGATLREVYHCLGSFNPVMEYA